MFCFHPALVTQPMLRCQPNRKELRLLDSYIKILCRFQKCKRKVPPPSLLSDVVLFSLFLGTAITTVGSSGTGSAGGGEVTNVRRRRKVCFP